MDIPEPEQVSAAGRTQLEADVISALLNLGYDRRVAEKAVADVVAGETSESFEAVLRATLQQLSSPAQKSARRTA